MSVTPKPGSSMARVADAARRLNLDVEFKTMDQSTRTAQEAADACGCTPAQIVKSLIFADAGTDRLTLVLVSGAHNADLHHLKSVYALDLSRADTRRVRDETGFAIGGVAPLGHLIKLPTYFDQELLAFDEVWAAAGRPDSVFRVEPQALCTAIGATIIDVVPS